MLTITNSGAMADYSYGDVPWLTEAESMKTLADTAIAGVFSFLWAKRR